MDKEIFWSLLFEKFKLGLNPEIILSDGVITQFEQKTDTFHTFARLITNGNWVCNYIGLVDGNELFDTLRNEPNIYYIVMWQIPEKYEFVNVKYVADSIFSSGADTLMVFYTGNCDQDSYHYYRDGPLPEDNDFGVRAIGARFNLSDRFGG